MDHARLLTDLQQLVRDLHEDLIVRLEEDKASYDVVHGEFETAKKAGRTAQGWEDFREDYLTQVAVAWVLSTVFVRFVEDNRLCDEPWLAGTGLRLQQVRDRYTAWIKAHSAKTETDREFLLHVFAQVAALPGLKAILGSDGHSLIWKVGPTADAARKLREFWLQAEGSGLRHDFTDPAWDTRFLGDLYQDLSQHAKDKYALLQTPLFVEEFILDRTLEPALAEFGLKETRLIDPACGSGHFLLGGFDRLFRRWQKQEPGTAAHVLAQRALDAIAGVDLNPFAVAISRFRLLLAALKACGVKRLKETYDFQPMVASGDSLLHGGGGARQKSMIAEEEASFAHFYASEDKELLRHIFRRRYQAVVGNPPYIVARDKALNELYRKRFPDVCHRKYSLGVPFTQLFFELARPALDEKRAPGHVGMITANSFMKREFGSKLIEEYLNKRVELSHVIDLMGMTKNALPGHKTPTAILMGRPRTAATSTIRAILGIKGEPSTPEDPSKGKVWTAIINQVDRPGSESEFVSCCDVPRERFASHPWSIGGGGAADLKEMIEEAGQRTLADLQPDVGRSTHTGEDDAFFMLASAAKTKGLREHCVPLVEGEVVRDYAISPKQVAVFPYDIKTAEPLGKISQRLQRFFWPSRTVLRGRRDFGKTPEQRGLPWYAHSMFFRDRFRTPLSIAFAFKVSHNHFVFDRGGKVFNRTAPVIKLPSGTSEDEHLGLLGVLNSSVACFWLKQVCQPTERGDGWDERYEFDSGKLTGLPITDERPVALAARLDQLGAELRDLASDNSLRSENGIRTAKERHHTTLAKAIAVQEESDWECYRHYGLLKDDLTHRAPDLPDIQLGQRAFEMVLARQLAAGKTTTAWFERHGVPPITEVPTHWPKSYCQLVQRRIDCIEHNANIRLVEQPEYKRRWNVEPFADQLARTQRSWLLDRMEDPRFWQEPRLISTARFADQLRHDPEFVQVANLYRGSDHHDFDALVRELIETDSVPFLPILRYKPPGLRKRAAWERTWDLQRQEDAGAEVGPIDPPPKYTGADFLKSNWWSLRGKLDVPKERFISYPHTERGDDPSPVFTWAGFDHLQQAKALAAYLLERREQDGWTAEKLIPLYAGLRELLPWLRQWHNDVDPESQQRLGDYFAGFLDEQLRGFGLKLDDLTAWTPPARRGRGRRAARARSEEPESETEDA